MIINHDNDNQKLVGVYVLKCKPTGKIYIGQTENYNLRMTQYKLISTKDPSTVTRPIDKALTEYGWDAFEHELLDTCDPTMLTFYEAYYIDKLQAYKPEIGYNVRRHEPLTRETYRMSQETREKMSKSHTGLKETAITKRKKSNQVYAISDTEFIIADSAKLLGDYLGKSKDYIKNCIRNPSIVEGYHVYYTDYGKRQEIREKVLQKKSKRAGKYLERLDYIDNSSVETIEKDYDIKYLTYENGDKMIAKLHEADQSEVE